MKRILDVAVSAIALLISAPLFIAVGAAVLVTSGSPIFFAHKRVGRSFRAFRLYKFRTMHTGQPGPDITASSDSRITPIGRILRRTKLDELPQLWNVLRGDMSLVGPRPEVSRYVQLFHRRYETLLTVRPGLTDPATLLFLNEENLLAGSPDPVGFYTSEILPKKLALAESYVLHQSVRADCAILLTTVRKLFRC